MCGADHQQCQPGTTFNCRWFARVLYSTPQAPIS